MAPKRPDGYASHSDYDRNSQSNWWHYLLLRNDDRKRWRGIKLGLRPNT